MISLKQFFAYNSLLFKPTPHTIRIYTFSKEDVDQLKELEIKTLDDCDLFYTQLKQLLEQYREEECMIAHNDEIESISQYSHTPSNRLTGQKKERFDYLQSMHQLLQALHSHNLSLPSLRVSIFSSQISSIETITSKRISTIKEKIKELQNSEKSQQSQRELKENIQKELFNNIEEYKKYYLKNKKLHKKFEKKISNINTKIIPLTNKIELYQRYISELETSLNYIESSQKSSYIPTYQMFISLGLLYYSKKNSKSYKIQEIESKIFNYKKKIEKTQTTILQLEQHRRELNKSLQEYAKLCDDEEIERQEQELQEVNEIIAQIRQKQDEVLSKREEYELELERVLSIQHKCSSASLVELLKKVSEQIEFIENQLAIYSQEPVNSLHDGYYYQK